MAKQFTNVQTFIIVLFIFGILAAGLVLVANEWFVNNNANPDNDSITYVAQLNKIDLSDYNVTKTDLEKSILTPGNFSEGNPKDQALEYLLAKEQGFNIELIVKGIFSLPEVILFNWFRLNVNDWQWIVIMLNWFWRISILIAIIYFVKGVNS